MTSFAIAAVVFGCCLGSAILGLLLRGRLPDSHLDADSKDVMKLVMGLISTIAALVLSLLIASANSSYNRQGNELESLSANAVLLNEVLISLGPEAKPARDRLRDALVIAHDEIWSTSGMQPSDLAVARRVVKELQIITPTTEAQRLMRDQAMEVGQTILQTRLLMFEQLGGFSWPFLTVLVFWIAVLFLGFGLFTRSHATILMALLLGAISVSGAVFLVMELSDPYHGLMRLSDAPVRHALEQIGR